MGKRREVLKGMALGGAAGAAAWKEPLVKGVVVPAHALTSGCMGIGCGIQAEEAGGSFLLSGGTIFFEGGSDECDEFSGSGPINADGTFEITGSCLGNGTGTVSGVVVNCETISGTITGRPFTGIIVANEEGCP